MNFENFVSTPEKRPQSMVVFILSPFEHKVSSPLRFKQRRMTYDIIFTEGRGEGERYRGGLHP